MSNAETHGATAPKSGTLHPVYTVTNIQNKVRILDGTKCTYSLWVKLFTLHAKGYRVLHHIDGTPAPTKTDPTHASWIEIDSIILQWIYETLSDDLLVRVLDMAATARTTWLKIQGIFLNNKGSRAATLEHEFTNLTLFGCSSMDEYCQKLKTIAEQLTDVDSPVSDSRLVLQLVRGLPAEFDTVATYINQSSPTWDVARGMLQLEQQRQSACQSPSGQQVLAATPPNSTPPPTPSTSQPPPPFRGPDSSHPRPYYRGRGRGAHYNHCGRGRGRYNPSPPAPWQWWNAPPCPYPSQPPTWTPPPWTNKQPAAHLTHGSHTP